MRFYLRRKFFIIVWTFFKQTADAVIDSQSAEPQQQTVKETELNKVLDQQNSC